MMNGTAIDELLAKEAARSAALAYLPLAVVRYFRDSKGEPLRLKDFHVRLIELLDDPKVKRLLILLPADCGKTTITRDVMAIMAVRDRNIRIMNIMNNATDAEQNLVAIEHELEDEKSPLCSDFGLLRGAVWKTTEMWIAGRTIKDKEPTIAAYGTGSNVFGHRADLIVCDDLLNLANAGPYVTDQTRRAVHQWFFDGVLKVAGESGKVVVIGTVMDFRDLYHELGDLSNPEHEHQESWVYDKHGFTVLRMQALVDDETKTVLWPERLSYDFLVQERAADATSFMRRRQNRAIESSLLTFDMERAQLCLDRSRRWGQITPEMRAGGFTTVYVTFDPTSGQTQRSKWCAICVGAFNPDQPPPRKFYVLKLYHFRALIEESEDNIARGRLGQVDYLIREHTEYGAAKTIFEANGAHQYVGQSLRLRTFRDSGHVIEPHYTSEENKFDPKIGVTSIAPLINALLIEFPYGDVMSRSAIDDFFAQELQPHPMATTTDRLMALWFLVLKAGGGEHRRFGVVRRILPAWAQVHGIKPQKNVPRVA